MAENDSSSEMPRDSPAQSVEHRNSEQGCTQNGNESPQHEANQDDLSQQLKKLELKDKKLELKKKKLKLEEDRLALKKNSFAIDQTIQDRQTRREQAVQKKRHQRRLEAIFETIRTSSSLLILITGIYCTATGNDLGPYLLGVGGTNSGIQAIARRASLNKEMEDQKRSSSKTDDLS